MLPLNFSQRTTQYARHLSFRECAATAAAPAGCRVRLPPPEVQHREDAVSALAKRGLPFLLVAFGVFFLLTRPEELAHVVEGAAVATTDALEQVAKFFSALLA
jgi:hypothetical protein